MTSRTAWFAPAALLLAVSCAAAPHPDVARLAHERFSTTPTHRMIGHEQMVASGAQTAEEVIRRFRPNLLTPQPSRTRLHGDSHLPVVYVNDLRVGGVEVLRSYPTSALRDVQYLTETEANTRWVGVHPAGAILLRTK